MSAAGVNSGSDERTARPDPSSPHADRAAAADRSGALTADSDFVSSVAGRRRRAVVVAVVIIAALLGALHLGAMIAEALPTSDMTAFGPGMGLFNHLNGFVDFDAETRAAISVLCGPESGPRTLADWAVVFAMWEAMVAAMMLPTAIPVVLAHADAARSGRTAFAVGLGYLAVWTGFAIAATLAQGLLVQARMMSPAGLPASLVLAGTTLTAAGLYQFTPWKWACLARCRRPGARFADAAGRSTVAGLRLGVAEGLDCLGCCWALMAAMFAVGVMNVVWIVGLGAVMIVEKLTSSWGVVRFVGVVLIGTGLAMLAASPVGAALLSRLV